MTTVTKPLHEALVGGLLGVAAGDALGATVEFRTPAQIAERYGVHRDIIGGGAFNWRPGQGTDDTDLTMAVIDGYLSHTNGGGSVLYCVAAEMITWFRTNPADIGGTTRSALARLTDTFDPSTSGATSDCSCGNGSLMRALPTALIRTEPHQRRIEAAEISAITHAHPRCVDSCIAYTEIAAALIDGADPVAAIDTARALDLDPTVRAALSISAEVPVNELSTSGYVIDSLTCAVWAIQQTDSFEDTLVALVNRGDDADTTGAIAGGLRGLIDGPAGIPDRWLERLEYAGRCADVAHELTRIRSSS